MILAAILGTTIGFTLPPAKLLPALAVFRIKLGRTREGVHHVDVMFLRALQVLIERAPVILMRPDFDLAPGYAGIV